MTLYVTGTKKCRDLEKLLHSLKVKVEVIRCINKVSNVAQEQKVSAVPFAVLDSGDVLSYKEIIKYAEEKYGN